MRLKASRRPRQGPIIGGHGDGRGRGRCRPSRGGEGARLRGQIFQARLEYLRDAHGTAGLQSVLAVLGEDDLRLLKALDRDGWYPFGLLARLDAAIAQRLAPDDQGIYERLGAASARHRTEWLGADARLYNVHGFLSRVADEHLRFHSFGRASYERRGFNEGVIAFTGYPEVYESFCKTSRGYFGGAVGFITGGPVRVEEPTCQCRNDDACRFHVRWGAAAL